jgi:hypothetical protein
MLIVVTFYPSSKRAERRIKSHFLKQQENSNQSILDLAHFCLIRFCARCTIGKPLRTSNPEIIQNIPYEWRAGKTQFGASIYEQLWNQRRSHPRLPVPSFMHHAAELMLAKGCEQLEGIFRLPGNLKRVDQIAQDVNKGKDALQIADLHDLASLYKKWFRDLPDPVVNIESLQNLVIAYETKTYLQFVDTLPGAHRYVLYYLVGFFQRLVKAEPITMMGPKNFAICFAPNIVQIKQVDEPTVKRFTDIGIELLVTLIADLDTSSIYPVRDEMMST